MTTIEEIKGYCRELSPPDAERAVKFNVRAKEEDIISYNLFIERKELPRQVFIHGYQAMFNAAALFLAKKYRIKIDDTIGGVHRNMRVVLDFYTRESEHNARLIELYETAIEKFKKLSQQYMTESHFAKKVVKDLMYEGYNRGKKSTYYSEANVERDPLKLSMDDAKNFVKEVVDPFLFIMDELTT